MDPSFLLMNVDIRGGFLSMTLVEAGDSLAEVTVNLDREEIGRYRSRLPDETYRQCDALLKESGFPSLDSPQTLAATVPTLSIGRGRGKDIQIKAFPISDVPTQVQPFVEAMNKAGEKLRQSKLRVLSGKAKPAKDVFDAKDALAFDVQLVNAGIEPLLMNNPKGDKPPTIQCTIAPHDPNDKSEPMTAELEKGNVVLPKDAPAQDFTGKSLRLLADETRQFQLTKRIYLRPGVYRAAISMHFTQIDPKDPTEITGSLTMEIPKFTIEGK
jgi:hypothetical protein